MVGCNLLDVVLNEELSAGGCHCDFKVVMEGRLVVEMESEGLAKL